MYYQLPPEGEEDILRFSSMSCVHLCRYWALRSSLKNTKAARPNNGKTPSIKKALNASLPDIESSSLGTIPSPPIPYLGLSTWNGRDLDDSSEAEINFDECSLNFLERSRPPGARPLVLPPVLHLAIICDEVAQIVLARTIAHLFIMAPLAYRVAHMAWIDCLYRSQYDRMMMRPAAGATTPPQ